MKCVKKWLRWMMMLPAMLLLVGCAATSGGNFCELAQPIWWANQAELDATPAGIVRQVVGHNEVWERVCGR